MYAQETLHIESYSFIGKIFNDFFSGSKVVFFDPFNGNGHALNRILEYCTDIDMTVERSDLFYSFDKEKQEAFQLIRTEVPKYMMEDNESRILVLLLICSPCKGDGLSDWVTIEYFTSLLSKHKCPNIHKIIFVGEKGRYRTVQYSTVHFFNFYIYIDAGDGSVGLFENGMKNHYFWNSIKTINLGLEEKYLLGTQMLKKEIIIFEKIDK